MDIGLTSCGIRRSIVTSNHDNDSRHQVRVAWIGPAPGRGGGVDGCAWSVVTELCRHGALIDCFLVGDRNQVSAELSALPGVRVFVVDTGWRFNRWYSKNDATKVTTGLAAQAWGRRRVARLLAAQHAIDPYGVLYQFSTIEVLGLRRRLRRLPPLVLHPSTTAIGELQGMDAERHLAARSEGLVRRVAMRTMQAFRAWRQRRDVLLADGVIGISRRFGDHLVANYGVDPRKVRIVPNPIDLDSCRPGTLPVEPTVRIAVVSRISARKGLDQIIELSHRIDDLAGQVVIEIIGGPTLWSDYRAILDDLNPALAKYVGSIPHGDLMAYLAGFDFLVQAATFEPFGLVVGESLACGVPVVATDAVGAAEAVDPRCCLTYPAGDVDALEARVREMVGRVRGPDREAIRRLARSEAERLFAPDRIGQQVFDVLATVARRSGPEASGAAGASSTPGGQGRRDG